MNTLHGHNHKNSRLYHKDCRDCRLELAAPELLEALKGMIKWTELTALPLLKDSELLPRGLDKWKEVINKAEGK